MDDNSDFISESQMEAVSRKMRIKNLLDQGTILHNNTKRESYSKTLDTLKTIIQESNDIINEGSVLERLGNSGEILLDMQLVKTNHKIITKVLDKNTDFNQEIYIDGILQLIVEDDCENWSHITKIACDMAYTVRSKPSMVGVLNVEPTFRVEKERQQRKRSTIAPEYEPEDVKSLKRTDHGAEKITEVYREFTKIFMKNDLKPVPLYKLVIDPHNLMRSVECAFHLAFLVRENKLALEKDNNDYPLVRLTTPEEREEQKGSKHFFLRIDMETCRKMTKYYKIRKPMLANFFKVQSQ